MCWPTRSGVLESSLCRCLLGISPSSSASSSALFKCLRMLTQDFPKPWLRLVSKGDRQTVVRRTDRNKKGQRHSAAAPFCLFPPIPTHYPPPHPNQPPPRSHP